MRRWISMAILGLSLVLCGAGAAWAADLPTGKINALKEGQATKGDIEASLGPAGYEDHNPDGRSVLLYDYSVPRAGKPPTGMAVGFLLGPDKVLLAKRFYSKPSADAPQAASQPDAPPPDRSVDPLDGAAMRDQDWANFDKSKVWAEAAAAGSGDQTLEVFPFRTVRKAKTQVGGMPANLSLEVARDSSGRVRARLNFDAPSSAGCSALRDRLSAVHGAPAATISTSHHSTAGRFDMVFANDDAQWRAGATTITLDCSSISVLGKTLFGGTVDLEPSGTAHALAAPVEMACPGLDLSGKGREPAAIPSLTFDLRSEVVRGPSPFIARLEATDAAFAFALPASATVRIDRAANTWRMTRGGKETVGACLVSQAQQ